MPGTFTQADADAALSDLIEQLKDPNANVRAMACQNLGQLLAKKQPSTLSERAKLPLIEAAKDSDARVRIQAVQALNWLPIAEDSINALLDRLNDTDATCALFAAQRIVNLVRSSVNNVGKSYLKIPTGTKANRINVHKDDRTADFQKSEQQELDRWANLILPRWLAVLREDQVSSKVQSELINSLPTLAGTPYPTYNAMSEHYQENRDNILSILASKLRLPDTGLRHSAFEAIGTMGNYSLKMSVLLIDELYNPNSKLAADAALALHRNGVIAAQSFDKAVLALNRTFAKLPEQKTINDKTSFLRHLIWALQSNLVVPDDITGEEFLSKLPLSVSSPKNILELDKGYASLNEQQSNKLLSALLELIRSNTDSSILVQAIETMTRAMNSATAVNWNDAITALVNLSKNDRNEEVQIAALKTLSISGAKSRLAIPYLLGQVLEESPHGNETRYETAVDALGHIANKSDKQVVSAFKTLVRRYPHPSDDLDTALMSIRDPNSRHCWDHPSGDW